MLWTRAALLLFFGGLMLNSATGADEPGPAEAGNLVRCHSQELGLRCDGILTRRVSEAAVFSAKFLADASG